MSNNKQKKEVSELDLEIEKLLNEHSSALPISKKELDILMAAEELFSEKGVIQSTTAAIAKRANVTEKTLFRYFPKKEVLIRRILLPIILKTILPYQLAQARKVIYLNTSSVEEFLRTILTQRSEAAKSNRSQFQIFINEIMVDEDLRKKAFEIAYKYVFADVKNIFEEFRNKKMIRQDVDIDLVMSFTIQAMMGQILMNIILPSKPIEINVDATIKLILHGIELS